MKLTDIHLDGFGLWSGLSLNRLSPRSTVFYGPNEAGKTTLLQFVRSVLYGFSPERRLRYLPPVYSERAGGTLTVIDADEGLLRIQRCESDLEPLGLISIEAADGTTTQNDAHLARLLHDVDETTFQNIFAVGLRELQELGTLDDLEAARWLYELTSGLDRVSLADVLSELENSRARLIADPVHGSDSALSTVVGRLENRRDKLCQEIAELSGQSHRYGQLLAERAAAQQEIAGQEQQLTLREAESRTLEAAVLVYDAWHQRGTLESQIAASGTGQNWPADAVQRIDRLSSLIRKGKKKTHRLADKRKSLREATGQIELNEAIGRQLARIAALAENENWIASLEQEIGQAEATMKRVSDEQLACANRLKALPLHENQSTTNESLAPLVERHWARLRKPAALLQRTRRHAKSAQQKFSDERSVAQNRSREVETALAARKQGDLTSALGQAGERVTQLRNRIQLDERIDQLAHSKTDLEQRISDLLQRQILPPWTIVALGAVFVLGVVLILGGLLLPASFIGGLGWPMAIIGLLGTGAAVAAKFSMESSLANQLATSQKQMELAEAQTKQARQDRDALDQALPKVSAPLGVRLQSAEKELADLEKLMPLLAERQSAADAMKQIESQGDAAQTKFRQAVQRWRAALAAAGLPENLKPIQARALAVAGREMSAIQRQLADAQSELDRRRRELAALASRIEQTFLAANLHPETNQASGQLRQLRRELTEQENRQQRRTGLRQHEQKLRRRRRAIQSRLRQLLKRRRRLLRQCGVADMAAFRARAVDFSKLTARIADRDAAAREIAAVLADVANEATIAALISAKTSRQLEDELAESKRCGEEIRSTQRRLMEQIGERNEQIRSLGQDRRLAVARFELADVERQFSAARHRWQVLSIVWKLLSQIKEHYERDRQPETLREASQYLSQFTAGRYRRVWTRLGENKLWVDDSENHTLPIDVLSHGTREQLFLSLRMSLVSLFSRRGVELPLVLDDVLVNFDTGRAAAAINTLRDFSESGHQILMFTCHEHIARLCKQCRMDVRRLPDNKQGGSDQSFESDAEPLPPKRSRPKRIKDEAPAEAPAEVIIETPPSIVEVAQAVDPPPVVPAPRRDKPAPVETEIPRATRFRLDLPQRVGRPSSIMRRWGAEEFSGELDDQINPLWLQSEITTSDAIMPPASIPSVPSPATSGTTSALRSASIARTLRVFDDESNEFASAAIPGKEDWDL